VVWIGYIYNYSYSYQHIMKALVNILFISVILISCSQPTKEKEKPEYDTLLVTKEKTEKPVTVSDYFKVIGDSAEIPSFEIETQLSEKAEKRLKEKKESVIVTAYFSGTPKDSTKYMDDGEYAVGTHSIELTDSRIAKFSDVKISKEMYESLADKDIQLLINVYSGRRSSKMNLLDCDILAKPVSEAKGQKFILKGKLIGE